MKITIVSTLPPMKGMSPYTSELVKALSQKIEIDFIGFKKLYPEFLYPGGTIDKTAKCPLLNNIKIRNILTWYNPFSWIWAGLTIKGDIVHTQWWSYVLAPVYFTFLFCVKFIRRKKIIITVHNILPHERSSLKDFLNRVVLSWGNHFIVHSAKNKKNFIDCYKIKEEEVSVIPMGILIPCAIKGISKGEARQYFSLDSSKKVLLCFGDIRKYKGVDVLIEAMNKVIKQIPNLILIIAGKPWINWSPCEKIIKEYHLENHIIRHLDFIPTDKIEYYFAATDLVVLPYKYFDAQSAVGALALSYDKPMIVSNRGGLPDFVKDRNAIFEPGNANELAGKILNILDNENLLKKLKNDSKELAQKYSWDKIAEKTVKLYQELIK